MAHVDEQILAAIRTSRPLPPRVLEHIDRCVACRRAVAAKGVSDAVLSSAIASAGRRSRSLATAAVLAGAVAGAAVAVPLRGAAFALLNVFEPHTVTAVPLTLDEMRSLGQVAGLSRYATSRELRTSQTASFTDARAAILAAGFALRQPTYAPDGLRASTYVVNGPSSELLTFNANRMQGNAAALPADIAHSALRIDLGATVLATYETGESTADELRLRQAMRRVAPATAMQRVGQPMAIQSTPATQSTAATRTIVAHRHGMLWSEAAGSHGSTAVTVQPNVRNGMPGTAAPAYVFSTGLGSGTRSLPLLVVQMPVPHVASSGVSLARLTSFMLTGPGVPPRVAAAFGALGDLSTTLPIPVPIDKAYTQPVFVDGVQGVGIGDDTGIGAAVIWQKNGMLYAVFAPRTARDVLAIANSLR